MIIIFCFCSVRRMLESGNERQTEQPLPGNNMSRSIFTFTHKSATLLCASSNLSTGLITHPYANKTTSYYCREKVVFRRRITNVKTYLLRKRMG